MKRELTVYIHPDGTVTYGAYCLRTDSWKDYVAFIEEAEKASEAGDLRASSRFLRAALMCLFSHIEGVVNAIYDQYGVKSRNEALHKRLSKVEQWVVKTRKLPTLKMKTEKLLRNLVAHPHDYQEFVFKELSIKRLRDFEKHLAPWLDAVCQHFGVSRLTDTEALAKAYADIFRGLGDTKITEV